MVEDTGLTKSLVKPEKTLSNRIKVNGGGNVQSGVIQLQGRPV